MRRRDFITLVGGCMAVRGVGAAAESNATCRYGNRHQRGRSPITKLGCSYEGSRPWAGLARLVSILRRRYSRSTARMLMARWCPLFEQGRLLLDFRRQAAPSPLLFGRRHPCRSSHRPCLGQTHLSNIRAHHLTCNARTRLAGIVVVGLMRSREYRARKSQKHSR
jgi:hypothetical protein